MKQIGRYFFPETEDELESWKPYTRYVALSSTVLFVMKTRIEGAWAAYCDSVPGSRHEFEWAEVLRSGTKLPEAVARVVFDVPNELPYAG